MAFIEPMHRNKPNITYLLYLLTGGQLVGWLQASSPKHVMLGPDMDSLTHYNGDRESWYL